MRNSIVSTLAGIIGVLLTCEVAAAQQMFSTRFGGASTKVVIGVVDGVVSIVEQRENTGECQIQRISNRGHLTSHVTFFAGDGTNRVRVPWSNWASGTRFCGKTVGPIQWPPSGVTIFELVVHGGNGDDIFLSSGHSSMRGGLGADVILSSDQGSGHMGGEGDDYLIEIAYWSVRGFMGGDAGNDRLCDLADGTYMRGGPDHDLTWNALRSDTTEGTMPGGEECNNVAWAVLLNMNF